MKAIAILSLVFLGIFTALGEIKADLLFSTDGGTNWSEDYPILKKGQNKFSLKVKYDVDENRKVRSNTIMCFLYANFDFASATGQSPWYSSRDGEITFNGDRKRYWRQAIPKYYKNTKRPDDFIFPVDLGERKSGVTGFQNQWDPVKKRLLNGPLPAVKALTPGTYRFTVQLHYSLQDSNEVIVCNKPFEVIIEK